MTIEKLVEKFRQKPYLLDMGAGKLSKAMSCTVEEIKEAKNIARNKDQFKEYCDANGIKKEDVNHYWHKGKHYSLHVENKQLSPEEQFKILLDECRATTKRIEFKTGNTSNINNVALINIYDIHLDKRNVNSQISSMGQLVELNDEILDGFGKLLNSVNVNSPSTFIIPIGNDIFTTNGFDKTTKRGTPQDPILPHDVIFKQGLSLIRTIIDELSNHGTVIVPMIYGNHDMDAVWYLGVALEVLYEKNDNVVVNNDRKSRKYYKFGYNMFGFGHGDLEKKNIDKLPLIMATMEPQMWAETKYRNFYLGDIHHLEEFRFFRTKDNPGCTVQFLRSAGITDKWHDDNMFVGVPRSMEASVFSAQKGQIANYNVNI